MIALCYQQIFPANLSRCNRLGNRHVNVMADRFLPQRSMAFFSIRRRVKHDKSGGC